eukprot:10354285-Alexandrium_andersonii.AAC.2
MHIGAMHTGARAHWCRGTLVQMRTRAHMHTGACICTLVPGHIGADAHWCWDTLVLGHTGAEAHWCRGTLVQMRTGAHMHTGADACWRRCTLVQVYTGADAHCCQGTVVQTLWRSAHWCRHTGVVHIGARHTRAVQMHTAAMHI